MNKKQSVTLGIVLGIIFFVIGFVYVTHQAQNLPSFFPGYTPGDALHHTKHAIAAFIVGLACFIFAWFQSGPKRN